MPTSPTEETDTIDATLHGAEAARRELERGFRAMMAGPQLSQVAVGGLFALAGAMLGECISVIEALLDIITKRVSATEVVEIDVKPAPADAADKRCRHEWATVDGVTMCTKCLKPKSAQGRRSKQPGAAPAPVTVEGVATFDPPSRPLPLGEDAANRFNAGGVGGPGARR